MAQGAEAMSTQPEALRLAEALDVLALGVIGAETHTQASAELRRLLSEALRIERLAYEQHTEIYGLRAQMRNLRHNNEVLTNALWKACGDDEQVVNDTIESQGALR
jgi:hypothetical protein